MANDALRALDVTNERLATIDKKGRVVEWASSNDYAGSNKPIATWIVAANRELQSRDSLIRELVRRLSEKDTC